MDETKNDNTAFSSGDADRLSAEESYLTRETEKFRIQSSGKFIFGLVVMLLGVWALLNRFGILPNLFDLIEMLFDYYDITIPVIIILLGCLILYRSIRGREKSIGAKIAVDINWSSEPSAAPPPQAATKRLYRAEINKKVFGICAGLADYFDWDTTFVRIGFALLVIASSGAMILVYFAMAIAIPSESELRRQDDARRSTPPQA
jgi:phage shock protein C